MVVDIDYRKRGLLDTRLLRHHHRLRLPVLEFEIADILAMVALRWTNKAQQNKNHALASRAKIKGPLARCSRPHKVACYAERERAQPNEHHFRIERYKQEQPAD